LKGWFLNIFRYPGGKSKANVRERIFKYFPYSYEEVRIPFVGGGGIFFHVSPSKKRWINDLDVDLMSVYKALRDRPEDFISKCREIPLHFEEESTEDVFNGRKVYNHRMRDIFDKFAHDEDMDQALRYFYVNRTVWGGRVNYEKESRLYFSNPPGWSIVKTGKLHEASAILQGVKITSDSYEKSLSTRGNDVLIYLDPPYFVNTELDENSKLYKHNFTIADHRKLAERIKECNHRFVISYDDDEGGFIRSLYNGFNFYGEQWSYSGTSSGKNQSKTKKVGNELIITNFKNRTVFDLFAD